ncbi:MAG TPA: TIGR03618 family F420-dependent PPOX class oxidoreductase [Acidimicrobiia bacterium]|nr:TIGR03618 family F420-dependent PPOX class oxidoreductase [Acidimicrobiia bacterium]
MAGLDDVRRLAGDDNGLAVVATSRRDGTVQSSVVNAGVLADPVDGHDVVGFVARGGTVKLANLRRDPRLTIVFRAGWRWTAVEGTAVLVGPDDARAGFDASRVPQLLREVFTAAGGTHDDWDEYDRVMAAERRTAVLVTPRRVYGTG